MKTLILLSSAFFCLNAWSAPEDVSAANLEFVTTMSSPGAEHGSQAKLYQGFEKLGGDPKALKQALCFLEKNKKTVFTTPQKTKITIENQRYIAINDLTTNSMLPRFFIVDLETGQTLAYYSGHGGGKTDAELEENNYFAQHVSNREESRLSPSGFFITGEKKKANDPRWKYNLVLHGVQKGINDNAYKRLIYIHSFSYVSEGEFSSEQTYEGSDFLSLEPQPLSQGCTMLSPTVIEGVMETIGAFGPKRGGSLYYNYSEREKNLGEDYCGEM